PQPARRCMRQLTACTPSSSTAHRGRCRRPPPSPACWANSASPVGGSQSSATARSCRAAATSARRSRRATASRSSSRWAADEREPIMTEATDVLKIGRREFSSRLLIGTGKYRDFDETRAAVEASGAKIVTVAIRRTNIGQNAGEPNLLDFLSPERFTILPNTAGCYSAEDAVRTLRLARELLDGHSLVKLEVLGDPQNLYPNMPETLKAAETLVHDGFEVRSEEHTSELQSRENL